MTLKHKNYTINLSPISEDEFILKFLIAETKSTRFSQDINLAIKRFNLADTIISQADLNNPQENDDRKRILEEVRRYLSKERLFSNFPDNVEWYSSNVSPDFLMNEVLYTKEPYWEVLSNGTRLPKNTVEKILKKERVLDQPYNHFLEASEAFKKNEQFTEVILVTNGKKFVILEGHLRRSVYALNQEKLLHPIPIILGISESFEQWPGF